MHVNISMVNMILSFDLDFANGIAGGYATGVGKGNDGKSIHGIGGMPVCCFYFMPGRLPKNS